MFIIFGKKISTMITAITAQSNDSKAQMDERFGRSPFFAIYDQKNGKTEFIKNPYKDDQGGVGTRIVELLANKDVTQIVAFEFGPKAKSLLEQLKIQMIVPEETNLSVNQIIDRIN